MPAQIRPTRLDVTDRFPMVGFRIRADGGPSQAEVAIAIDPALFTLDRKKDRTAANFYSTRGNGGVRFQGSEAGYTVPPEVLARFIGNEKLYFGLATAGDGGPMKVAVMPNETSPYISIRGLSGRSMSRVRVLPNRQQRAAGYKRTSQEQLEWAGDAPAPGMAPVGNGASPEVTPTDLAPNGSAAPAHYDDGFGPMPEASTPAAQSFDRPRALAFETDVDPETLGIEGPAYSEPSAGQPVAQARAMALVTADYDRVARIAPSVAFTSGRSGKTIDHIVIHITDAPTTSSTVNTFTAADARASAHYLVGQDGEIVQFVSEDDTAWHAKGVNSRSVGIEHVAIKVGGADYPRRDGTMQHFDHLPPTDTQYCESAALVSYLCDKYGLTPDRTTIIGHREADPKTSHTSCPDGAWDWDHFMDLVTNRYCAPQPVADETLGLAHAQRAVGLTIAGSWTVNWDDVELIPQPSDFSCWAAAGAMLVGWRDRVSLTPETVGEICSRSTGAGLDPGDVSAFGTEMGLVAEPPVSYSVEGFRALLESSGPLWVAEALPGSLHAIIVTGLYSDGTDTFVRIADPWDRVVGTPGEPGAYASSHSTGSRYIMRYEDFHAQYESAINGDPPNRQILHSGNPNALAPNTGQTAPPPGYAQGLGVYRAHSGALGTVLPSFSASDPRGILTQILDFFGRFGEWSAGVDSTRSMPHSAICQLLITNTDGTRAGATGFYAGPGLIVTCAHALANAASLEVFAGRTDGDFLTRFNVDPADWSIHPHFAATDDAYDIAVIRVQWAGGTAPNGNYFELQDLQGGVGSRIIVSGYAGDNVNINRQHMDGSTIHELSPDGHHINYNLQTAGGESGAPVLALLTETDQDGWADAVRVVGIHVDSHSLTRNLGVRLTPEKISWILNRGMVAPAAYGLDTEAPNESAPTDAELTLAPPPEPRARALALDALGTVSTIGGLLPLVFSDSSGDISWDLDQFKGLKHPGDKAPASPAPFTDAAAIRLDDWPKLTGWGIDDIYAWFTVDWQHNGTSLGNVRIGNIGTNDAKLMKLKVRAQIMDDNILYEPGGIAALRIRFHYRFSRTPGDDIIAVTELQLFADGTYLRQSNWLQKSTI